jgi:DNA-binding LacI/PurR family transcriptional regulator
MDVESIAHFHREAAARGFETGPHSVIGLDPARPEWAKNALFMMMRQDSSTRPDGLIIADDHLVSHTVQGIVELGLSNPKDLETIGYWNFTHDPLEASFITHLGSDVSEIIRTCIAQLNAHARGEKVPAVTRIAPVFGRQSVDSNVTTEQYSPAMNTAAVA